jgi:hypothetical protein
MVTNLNVHLISSTLSSLSLGELHFLKDKIDALIKEYSTEQLSKEDVAKSLSVEVSESSMNHWLTQMFFEYSINYQNSSYKQELAKIILPLFAETQEEDKEQIKLINKKNRKLGIWKGQIEVSEDFYETSNEILSEFGIEE